MKMINQFIRNANKYNCFECAHYKPSLLGGDISRCSRFGEKNVVDGRIRYEWASVARIDNKMCGEHGRYFDMNYRYIVWRNRVAENMPLIAATCSILVYFGVVAHLVSSREKLKHRVTDKNDNSENNLYKE
jgi:hypothetical protein